MKRMSLQPHNQKCIKSSKSHPTPREIYTKQLIGNGVIDQSYAEKLMDEYRDSLDDKEHIVEFVDEHNDEYAVDWTPHLDGDLREQVDTTINEQNLKNMPKSSPIYPMTLNPILGLKTLMTTA